MIHELDKTANIEVARFARDAELAFRVRNRRNRLLGLWVASQLQMSGAAAAEYARKLVHLGVDVSQDAVIVEIVHGELQEGGVDLAVQAVRDELNRLADQASRELAGSGAAPTTDAGARNGNAGGLPRRAFGH